MAIFLAFILHPQVRIVETATALGTDQGADELQRIAHRQPVHRFLERSGLVQLIFFATDHQPGTDMFGQYDDGFFIQQALILSLLQVSRELAVQAFGALIIGGEQLGLDTQQIAAIGGGALIDRKADTQIRQVMTHRTVRGPHGVGREDGDQRHGEGQVQKFAHGETVNGRVRGSRLG
ncbi:hypothetical protein ABH910_002993 [Pseudomonas sp. YL-218 TE3947]